MNTFNTLSYQKSFQLFKRNQKSLPDKIKWKLNYISVLIQDKSPQKNQNLSDQYYLEIIDLKDVNKKGLQIIFISIVQTLFNQQYAIDKQCLIRKKGFFKSWHDGFIKYDDVYIYLNSQNRTSRYKFKNLDLKLNKNSKRSFDFYYKGYELMTIKFQKPESMNIMYKTIRNLIYQAKNKYDQEVKEKLQNVNQKEFFSKNNKKQKISAKIQYQNYQSDEIKQSYQINVKSEEQIKAKSHEELMVDKFQIEKYQKYLKPKDINAQKSNPSKIKNQKRTIKQLQFEKSFISQKQKSILLRNHTQTQRQLKISHPPQDYQIKTSSKNMYLALHKKQIKLIIEILFKIQNQLSLEEIMSNLGLYLNWNTKVLKQELCYKMKFQQKSIIYRVYEKSNSILSKSRQTYTMLEFKRLNKNTAILLQQSLENQDKQQNYMRAYLKTIFYVQKQSQNIKLSIQSEYDPKGFCTFSESQELLISLYKDIIHLQNFLNEYSIKNQKSKQKQNKLFIQKEYSGQNQTSKYLIQKQQLEEQKQFKKYRTFSKSINQDVQAQKSSDQDQNKNNRMSLQIYRRSTKRDPFFQLKPDNPNKVPTLQYLELIKKKQFQKYYLNKKFNIQVQSTYEDYIPWYCLEQLLKKGGQYQITEKLELHFINQKLIQSQKDILRFIIRQIGANIISGKSVLNVSLPVDIFQPRSLLQRSAASLGKCPDYLLKVYKSDPLQQLMNVTALIATVPTLELVMQKPFNPILGQTFQAYLKGIPISYEQISHHPPISSYYMECQQFKLFGNLIAFADVGLNSGVGGNLGVMHIIFKNNTHFECYFPPSQISGLIYGDRKFRSYGKGYILQRNKKLFSQFSIQKIKKGIYQSKDKLLPGSIIGGIFKVNEKFIEYLDSFNSNLKKFPGILKEHIVQKLVHINGVWFDKIWMNDKIINQNIRAYPVQYYPYSLPSDSNFRLDVLYHKQNNLPQSQRQKQVLQNIQRQDRKLRQKYQKLHKKK